MLPLDDGDGEHEGMKARPGMVQQTLPAQKVGADADALGQ